ncbi:hypothetical protein SynBIOSE41_01876 [Synechococcus sp. BIOS-E4-1]|nr:hypothetical protein SynBIOSE41_01876 [Synechococcus sp. BIOS-E4-1]
MTYTLSLDFGNHKPPLVEVASSTGGVAADHQQSAPTTRKFGLC